MNIKTIFSVSALTFGVLFAGSAHALQCPAVLPFAVPDDVAKSVLNEVVKGKKEKLAAGRSIIIRGVNSLSGDGNCHVRAVLAVTMTRPVLSDKKGTVLIKGDIKNVNGKMCLSNPYVVSVDLSGIGALRESLFKFIANKAIPDPMCF